MNYFVNEKSQFKLLFFLLLHCRNWWTFSSGFPKNSVSVVVSTRSVSLLTGNHWPPLLYPQNHCRDETMEAESRLKSNYLRFMRSWSENQHTSLNEKLLLSTSDANQPLRGKSSPCRIRVYCAKIHHQHNQPPQKASSWMINSLRKNVVPANSNSKCIMLMLL